MRLGRLARLPLRPGKVESSRAAQKKKGPPCGEPLVSSNAVRRVYDRCLDRCLFISNMVQRSLPKIFFSLSSATISRLF